MTKPTYEQAAAPAQVSQPAQMSQPARVRVAPAVRVAEPEPVHVDAVGSSVETFGSDAPAPEVF